MENHGNWIGSFILFRDIKEQIFLILANVQRTHNVRTTYESATLLYGFVIIFFEGF